MTREPRRPDWSPRLCLDARRAWRRPPTHPPHATLRRVDPSRDPHDPHVFHVSADRYPHASPHDPHALPPLTFSPPF